jgi:hypothetical protein
MGIFESGSLCIRGLVRASEGRQRVACACRDLIEAVPKARDALRWSNKWHVRLANQSGLPPHGRHALSSRKFANICSVIPRYLRALTSFGCYIQDATYRAQSALKKALADPSQIGWRIENG